MSKPSGIFRSLLYSSANVYTEYVLGLVVSIVIARSLGPDEFGVYSLLVWICALSITVINAGISVGAIKFTSEFAGRGEEATIPVVHQYLSKIQKVKGAIFAVVFAALILVFPSALADGEYHLWLWLIIPAVVLKALHMFQVGLIKGYQAFHALAKIAVIVAPLNVLFVGIAYFLLPTVGGYLAAFVLTSLVYFLVSTQCLNAVKVHPVAGQPTVMDAALKARVNRLLTHTSLITVCAYIVFGQSELIFLKHLGSASDIAFFSVGFVLARAASALVPGVYNNILLPRISYAVGRDASKASATVLTASRHMLFLGLFVAIPIAVFAEPIVLMFYGEEYRMAYIATAIFALVSVLTGIRDTTNAYLVSVDEQPLLLKIISIAFVTTLVLDVVLIAWYGLAGAIFAFAVVELFATIAISWFAFRRLDAWPAISGILRALLAAATSAGAAYVVGGLVPHEFGFLLGAASCPVFFIGTLFLFNAFDRDDYVLLRDGLDGRKGKASRMLGALAARRIAASQR